MWKELKKCMGTLLKIINFSLQEKGVNTKEIFGHRMFDEKTPPKLKPIRKSSLPSSEKDSSPSPTTGAQDRSTIQVLSHSKTLENF